MNSHICKICSNNKLNISYFPKETMYGTDEQFEYIQCSYCGTLQILEIPGNIASYYSDSYYSFTGNIVKKNLLYNIKEILKKEIIKYKIYGSKYFLGMMFSNFYSTPYWMNKKYLNLNSRILDLGCGTGKLLKEMNVLGFRNLIGVDPYLDSDLMDEKSIKIFKKSIYEIEENFDFIMMHHSFEHMDEPQKVLNKLYSILNPKSYLLIRIPICSSYAFRKYGINWVQLDAPRHYFLHTTKSIRILANKAGFNLSEVIFDSDCMQFIGSMGVEKGIPWIKNDLVHSKSERNKYKNEIERLNSNGDGDQAGFILFKP